jgi:hypothetical protein
MQTTSRGYRSKSAFNISQGSFQHLGLNRISVVSGSLKLSNVNGTNSFILGCSSTECSNTCNRAFFFFTGTLDTFSTSTRMQHCVQFASSHVAINLIRTTGAIRKKTMIAIHAPVNAATTDHMKGPALTAILTPYQNAFLRRSSPLPAADRQAVPFDLNLSNAENGQQD